jgi:hypothetical protein
LFIQKGTELTLAQSSNAWGWKAWNGRP